MRVDHKDSCNDISVGIVIYTGMSPDEDTTLPFESPFFPFPPPDGLDGGNGAPGFLAPC